jgi:hypothetical protein
VKRPSTFAELQDAADRQLALLEQQALGGLLGVFPLIGLVVVGTLKDRRAKELNLPD